MTSDSAEQRGDSEQPDAQFEVGVRGRIVSKAIHLSLAAGFIAIISTPGLVLLFSGGRTQGIGENRDLAALPAIRSRDLETLPPQFEAYFDDHFGLRRYLINAYSTFNAYKRSINPWKMTGPGRVIEGKDGWLFYADEEVWEDFTGQLPFTQRDLERWERYLSGRQAWLKERGIAYRFVIVPNKCTIYPEQLPQWVRERRGQSRKEQLLEYLDRVEADVRVLDLRDALESAKRNNRVYSKYDTHWNGYGRLASYQRICEELQSWNPSITALPLDHFEIVEIERQCDLDGFLLREVERPYEVFQFRNPPSARYVDAELPEHPWPQWMRWQLPLRTENPTAKGRLLLFGDSFFRTGGIDAATRRDQPLAEHFNESLFVNGQFPHAPVSFEMLDRLVAHFQPDVVIEERVERYLRHIPMDHAEYVSARHRARSP